MHTTFLSFFFLSFLSFFLFVFSYYNIISLFHFIDYSVDVPLTFLCLPFVAPFDPPFGNKNFFSLFTLKPKSVPIENNRFITFPDSRSIPRARTTNRPTVNVSNHSSVNANSKTALLPRMWNKRKHEAKIKTTLSTIRSPTNPWFPQANTTRVRESFTKNFPDALW